MKNDIKKQISERYFQEYFDRTAQKSGWWSRFACSEGLTINMNFISLAAGGVSFAGALLIGAPLAGAISAMLAVVGAGATVTTACLMKRYKTTASARKKINRDIANGHLVQAYNNGLGLTQRRSLSANINRQSAFEQISGFEGFDKVTIGQGDRFKDVTAQRTAAASKSKNTHSMK